MLLLDHIVLVHQVRTDKPDHNFAEIQIFLSLEGTIQDLRRRILKLVTLSIAVREKHTVHKYRVIILCMYVVLNLVVKHSRKFLNKNFL